MKLTRPTSTLPLAVIEPDNSTRSLLDLDSHEIKEIFKQYGAMLFRGFPLNLTAFTRLADQYCNRYVRNKSQGRQQITNDGRVQTVNLGHRHFPLHPEISREPWQPDIVFFGCEHPAQAQGETTLCDGVKIYNAFPEQLRTTLKGRLLAHKVPTDLAWCADFLQRPALQIEELEAHSDRRIFQFSVEDGEIYRTYLRPFMHRPLFTDQMAYGNFLVFARRNLNSYSYPTFDNGEHISDALVEQIEAISNNLSYAHEWQKNDVLMLDNTRYMHGRNPIGGDPLQRRIYSQFGYCSFLPDTQKLPGYGIWR